MKFKNTSYKYLVIALVCFAVAAVLNIYVNFLHPPQVSQKVEEVNSQLNLAIRKAQRDLNRVKPYLSNDTVNFHDLLNDPTYFPTYIFRNNQLVFWTNHTLVTDFALNLENNSLRVTENKFGKFLVSAAIYKGYQIQVFITLERQYGINNTHLPSGLDEEIFNGHNFKIYLQPDEPLPQVTYGGKYLFSVEPPKEDSVITISRTAIALIIIGLVALVWGLFRSSVIQLQRGHWWQSLVLFFLPLLTIRVLLLYFNFPFLVWELQIFNPRLYAASFWSPSMGDFLLNALLLLTFTLHLNYLFRRRPLGILLRNISGRGILIFKIGSIAMFCGLILWLYHVYYTGFSNSSLLIMDITQSLEFSVYKGIFYFTFVIHTVVFLVMAHLLMQAFAVLQPDHRRATWLGALALGGVIFIIAGILVNRVPVILLGFSFFFCLTILFIHFKKNISSNPFQNYLYIFSIIAISALAGSLALYQHYHRQLIDYKQKFATNLFLERDIEGEYLLEEITRKIQADRMIRNLISGPFMKNERVQEKIKYYLRDYFVKYESTALIFDASDLATDIIGNRYTLAEYRKRNLQNAIETEHPGLYLVKKGMQPFSRRYVKLIPVYGIAGSKVTIALELNLTKLMPYSVVPELLVDKSNLQPLSSRSFSYAIYQGQDRKYSEGPFAYIHTVSLIKNPALYDKGVRLAGFHHLGFISGYKRIIISTEQYTFFDVVSNFSFLFLVHTFVFFLYMLVFLMIGGGLTKALNTNFSTKIQLFLNFGILIPLLVVSVATASLVTASYKRDLQDSYEKRGRLVQKNILNSWSWVAYRNNLEALQEEVIGIADLSEADINLYDARGRLITSTQPLIFEKGLLSEYINPQAFADIKEDLAQNVPLKEKMGSLSYNALYLPLPSIHQAGGVDGFIGIPFFDSEKELESKLIDLFTTTMNIFVIMFLVFLILTNWAARTLTVPLKLVAQKLKQTTLTGQNKELVYESADEIGILVSEYNQMLRKLDENKKELAMREKEAAWREMARQVAHEIKNPLTPMKLSLQYLQKAISEKRENLDVLINKISGTLITQIEILSDIATSFSNFTALPDLKIEKINLAAILKQSLDLHSNPGTVHISRQFAEDSFEVMADENILMRTFNNLMINALQAMPAGRHPEILVSLEKDKNNALIRFRDNGAGIPAEIQHKIFVPNFSTKFSGSGIGLAVAKKGIESAGGRIWFETQEGEGTTFYITLPLVQE